MQKFYDGKDIKILNKDKTNVLFLPFYFFWLQ